MGTEWRRVAHTNRRRCASYQGGASGLCVWFGATGRIRHAGVVPHDTYTHPVDGGMLGRRGTGGKEWMYYALHRGFNQAHAPGRRLTKCMLPAVAWCALAGPRRAPHARNLIPNGMPPLRTSSSGCGRCSRGRMGHRGTRLNQQVTNACGVCRAHCERAQLPRDCGGSAVGGPRLEGGQEQEQRLHETLRNAHL